MGDKTRRLYAARRQVLSSTQNDKRTSGMNHKHDRYRYHARGGDWVSIHLAGRRRSKPPSFGDGIKIESFQIGTKAESKTCRAREVYRRRVFVDSHKPILRLLCHAACLLLWECFFSWCRRLLKVARDFNETRASDVFVVNFGGHYHDIPEDDEEFKKDMIPVLEDMAVLGQNATVVWR